MNPRITFAVATRVLTQIRRDHRTAAMLLVLPCLLMTLLWWMFVDSPVQFFDRLGPGLLALFPFIIMFLVTSVTTLRERSSGTLERLLAMPMGKLDFLLGLRHRLRRGGRDPVRARRRALGGAARARRAGPGLAADRRGDRGCRPRVGARPVRQRLRDDGVPGGAVHAGLRRAADPAVRTVHPARAAAPGAGGDQQRAAVVLRHRRDADPRPPPARRAKSGRTSRS